LYLCLCFFFYCFVFFFFCFFFQAEDGIRDRTVTGVQTCALPILHAGGAAIPDLHCARILAGAICEFHAKRGRGWLAISGGIEMRSEERRVGKEGRSRWWADH